MLTYGHFCSIAQAARTLMHPRYEFKNARFSFYGFTKYEGLMSAL
jgi:hypothetical protein